MSERQNYCEEMIAVHVMRCNYSNVQSKIIH